MLIQKDGQGLTNRHLRTLSHQSTEEFGVLAVAFGALISLLGGSSADNRPIVDTSKHLESRLDKKTVQVQVMKRFFCILVVLY